MERTITTGLVGDYNESVPAHRAIPLALSLAAQQLGYSVEGHWLPTETIHGEQDVQSFDGIWCVPASPYRSMDGALNAIRFARENHRPFLGTCGGFQHAVLEYAHNVLGWTDAEHGETSPEAARAVITPLACSLVEATDRVRLVAGSRIARAYDNLEAEERYRCRYGINRVFEEQIIGGPLQITATDANGEIRAIELTDHPFFVATLFQPERAALAGVLPPLVAAFVQSMLTG
jgi:CTP synthase (UTP-ammonia lyase)